MRIQNTVDISLYKRMFIKLYQIVRRHIALSPNKILFCTLNVITQRDCILYTEI